MVLLDTETTGLSSDNASIIELGMVKVTYSPSAQRIVSILDVVSMYEDPSRPIPELVTKLTGITNEMVQGQHIDDTLVDCWFAEDPLVVAHNARFDRPFFEKRFVGLRHLAWGCSASEIDWKGLGFESCKLEYLLLRLGWFYVGHRAVTDCLAIAWLFYLLPGEWIQLSELDRRTILVRAFGAPFNVKDHLKKRGYRWHDGIKGSNKKHWWHEIDEDELPRERDFLDNLYHLGSELAHYDYKDARDRFKGTD